MPTISEYTKNFTVGQNQPNKPYYNVHVTMHHNDGDYVSGDIQYDVDEWNEKPDIFFLVLAYLGQGYSGKFSHGHEYYGHHFEYNKHGLYDAIVDVASAEKWLQYTDWGLCHSFSDIIITYFVEENKKYGVTFKTVDDIFNTEEEMLETIKEAYNKWAETVED